MRAYHRLDPLMDERKSHYTPAQLGAFVKVQLVAGRQKVPGHFRSLAAVRGTLPEGYVKHLAFLLSEGDLIVMDDGTVYLDGWDEWQEGDLTVSERMARLRNRKRNNGVTEPVTLTVTEPSPSANANAKANAGYDGEGSGEGFAGGGWPSLTKEAIAAFEERTGQSWSLWGDKQLAEYDRLIGAHGLQAVLGVIDRIRNGQRMTARQVIWPAMKLLEPFADTKTLEKQEREKETAKQAERRAANTLRDRHEEGWHKDSPDHRCPLCPGAAA